MSSLSLSLVPLTLTTPVLAPAVPTPTAQPAYTLLAPVPAPTAQDAGLAHRAINLSQARNIIDDGLEHLRTVTDQKFCSISRAKRL